MPSSHLPESSLVYCSGEENQNLAKRPSGRILFVALVGVAVAGGWMLQLPSHLCWFAILSSIAWTWGEGRMAVWGEGQQHGERDSSVGTSLFLSLKPPSLQPSLLHLLFHLHPLGPHISQHHSSPAMQPPRVPLGPGSCLVTGSGHMFRPRLLGGFGGLTCCSPPRPAPGASSPAAPQPLHPPAAERRRAGARSGQCQRGGGEWGLPTPPQRPEAPAQAAVASLHQQPEQQEEQGQLQVGLVPHPY